MNNKNIIENLFKGTLTVFILSMLSTAIGNFIDGIIIGNFLGENFMAAFGFTIPYQKFIIILPNVLAMSMQILCNQQIGRGNLQTANGIFSLSVAFSIITAIIFCVATFLFGEQIANYLGADKSFGIVHNEAVDYLKAFSLGLPAMYLFSLLIPVMQIDSDRNRTTIAVTVLSIANIFCDLINIFVFNGSLFGMGLATTFSYFIGLSVLILHFFKPESCIKYSFANIKISNLSDLMLIGSPVVLGRASSMLQSGFLNYLAVGLAGSSGVAAVAILTNFILMFESFPKAIGSSVQMIGGILIGEEDKKSILQLVKIAVKYSFAISSALIIIMVLFAPQIADIYTKAESIEVCEMVIEGLYFFAPAIPFILISALLQYFYQAYGRYKLVNFLAVMNNIILIVPTALITAKFFDMTGIWLAVLLSQIAFLVFIIFYVWICKKKITFDLADILLLPEDFGSHADEQINMSVTSIDEVIGLSTKTYEFCKQNKIDSRRSYFAALCVEEMARNVIEHGFDDKKNNSVDVRIIVKNNFVTLRIRDDCKFFNPKEWLKFYNDEDTKKHMGLMIVSKIAKDFRYINALKLNNLIIKI